MATGIANIDLGRKWQACRAEISNEFQLLTQFQVFAAWIVMLRILRMGVSALGERMCTMLWSKSNDCPGQAGFANSAVSLGCYMWLKAIRVSNGVLQYLMPAFHYASSSSSLWKPVPPSRAHPLYVHETGDASLTVFEFPVSSTNK